MSILIKGMEMPKSCFNCHLRKNNICYGKEKVIRDSTDRPLTIYELERIFPIRVLEDCPLVEIPSKHGDLIDRDELKAKIEKLKMKSENGYINVGLTMALGLLQKSAPTIIEAEG